MAVVLSDVGTPTTLVVVADLDAIRQQSRSCERCDLYPRATQTVFGDGDPHSPVVLVGEQPDGYRILATTHPSAVLRAPDETAREADFAQLVDDLSNVAAILSR